MGLHREISWVQTRVNAPVKRFFGVDDISSSGLFGAPSRPFVSLFLASSMTAAMRLARRSV